MIDLQYDETDPLSIESYSQNLIGKTFSDILNADSNNTEIIKDSSEQLNGYKITKTNAPSLQYSIIIVGWDFVKND